ncbi:MAG: hypothetical protein WC246_00030 [Candidatus Paceibacterota bacterium]|jgi:3D (Asp-Asp-Asp) domain-containing protein
MGKRTALWIAIAAIVLSATLRVTATVGEHSSDSLGRFLGIKTLASELPVVIDTSHREAGISDAIAPTTILFAPTIAAQTEQISVWATAYSSELAQTDETPFITASGATVHDGVAAANFLPLGTTFTIPQLYGDKTFTVEDRMNKKYDGMNTIDVWFPNTQKAINFGRRAVAIVVTK